MRRKFHMEQNGWSDLAQHLTIDPQGGLWTGRNLNLATGHLVHHRREEGAEDSGISAAIEPGTESRPSGLRTPQGVEVAQPAEQWVRTGENVVHQPSSAF
jgi:hypothetical protein